MTGSHPVTVTVNGATYERLVPARLLLSDFLREELKLLGYRAEEMVGKVVWRLIVMEEASRRAIEQKLKGERELKPFVRSFRRADGTAIALLLADRHLRGAGGEITGLRTALVEVATAG